MGDIPKAMDLLIIVISIITSGFVVQIKKYQGTRANNYKPSQDFANNKEKDALVFFIKEISIKDLI